MIGDRRELDDGNTARGLAVGCLAALVVWVLIGAGVALALWGPWS